MRFGYIDESIHDRQGLYLLALVCADPSLEGEVRERLLPCTPRHQRPHWHAELEATRDLLVQVIAALPISARVYGCRFTAGARQEAARARALSWAAQELAPGIRHLVIDRREERQNQIDRRVLTGVAGRPQRFTFMHAASEGTPMLWLADIVVGAAAAQLARGEERHLKVLGPLVEHVSCELTAS
ncbi:hypothetical protein [Nonomuraea sp. bgisy101]|uniref:hypothetical protein n=1 Tax=Nonomuraea sp. bgisy101 TaxID=3413784 RepID=UPI003D712D21